MLPYWLDGIVNDDGLISVNPDKKVFLSDDCGNIFTELFKYAIKNSEKKIIFPQIISKNKELLVSLVKLPTKSEEDNFLDLRFTVKAYKNIFPTFLSTYIIKKFASREDEIRYDLFNLDIRNRASLLEFYLLNNPDSIKNRKGYYDGLIELQLYRLLQEMYSLALSGNEDCKWMLSFSTPSRIWFLITVQHTYLMWEHSFKGNNNVRKDYNNLVNLLNNLNEKNLKNKIDILKDCQLLNISLAFEYTITKLLLNHINPIATYYTEYLKSLKKQAHALSKGNVYHAI